MLRKAGSSHLWIYSPIFCNFTTVEQYEIIEVHYKATEAWMGLDYGSVVRNVGLKVTQCAACIDAQKGHVSGILAFHC